VLIAVISACSSDPDEAEPVADRPEPADVAPAPLIGSTDPTADRWDEAGFGQPLRLTVQVHPGEVPGTDWYTAIQLRGPTDGWASCTGQTRLTWEADGEVYAAVGDMGFALAPEGESAPAVTPEVRLQSGSMVLNSCEVPAFAHPDGYLDDNGDYDDSVSTVTVAIEATTYEWSCIDEVYALDIEDRDTIDRTDDCG